MRYIQRNLQSRRSGVTLLEVVISAATTAVLMGGLGAAVYVSSRASENQGWAWDASQTSEAVSEVLSEIRFATRFVTATTTTLEFEIPDRTGDGSPETVRYAWSGSSGSPFTRKMNGGLTTDVLEAVHVLQFTYEIQTDRYTSVSLITQTIPDARSRVDSAVNLPNTPEVAAP